MSWLSGIGHFFTTAGHDVVVGLQAVAPYVAAAAPYTGEIAAVPVVGGPIVLVLNAIVAAEKLVPAPNSGPTKKTIVTAIVNSAYSGIDQATLSKSIDEIVAAFGALDTATAPLTAAVKAAKPTG